MMGYFAIAFYMLILHIQVKSENVPQKQNTNFRFTKQLYNVSIPENSIGKNYAKQSPGDDFMGIKILSSNFSDIRYKIVEGDRDKFFKAEHRTIGDFCFLFIRLKTGNNDVLNRERKDNYILRVKATALLRDGKHLLKSNFVTETVVVVNILDVNDLNPLFYPIEYSIIVNEDAPIHQSLLKVVAEDADLGRNGEIYYSFLEENNNFIIHTTSGIISLSRPLRYNEASHYELIVLGQDRGTTYKQGKKMVSKAKVTIQVNKVNFHSPEIRIRRFSQIVENSNADIYAIVNVVDKDKGIHGEIESLEIVDGDPDGHFRIKKTKQPGQFNIEVLKLLDRERTPKGYSLKLRAIDKGIPPKESYKDVPVLLIDLNDNAPIFTKEIYDVKVSETAPINTPLIRLKVTDSDEGKNAQVFLEIVGGNEGGEFFINGDTGMLYTASLLDAEYKQFYSLTVSAIDQGNVGTRKQSSAKVKIYVEDENDNDPKFDRQEMVVWINENMPAGTSVTTVHAKDKDRGENAYISYMVANLNTVPFDIDHFSGLIKTTALLDYESMRREYIVRVRASDWGLPYRRQSEMQLIVKLKDINDNRPQFEKIDCIGYIPRHTSIGSEIFTLSAIDFDSGNIISYRIVSGNEDNCFKIDAATGTISVSCNLNNVDANERELNVTATDGTHFADISYIRFKLTNKENGLIANGKYLSDSLECKETNVANRLREVLADAENNNKEFVQEDFAMMPTRYGQNIHAPELADFPIEIQVNESVALGTTLLRLNGRDRDLGYNGKLIYGISDGDPHSQFSLDMNTGDLKVIGYLDREKKFEYFLNLSVYDLGKPQKSSSRILPITVLDVNDNPPVFEKNLASFRVTENAINGTSIFKANATDADEGDNGKIVYTLITDTNDFTLDKTSGLLSVFNALDREKQDTYELHIKACDKGTNSNNNFPLCSKALIRIFVDDINDNAPTFNLPNYIVQIREDVPLGTVVTVLTASDPDLGNDGEVSYLLEDSDSDGTFKIDRLSGVITTTKLLDFEERQVHSLLVKAKDNGNPSLSSEVSVTINVVDVNENLYAPQFSDFVMIGKVFENKPIGTFVMKIIAKDMDPLGGDSTVEYSIRGGDGNGYFSIDNQGNLRTLNVLDTETKSDYWLTVYAQDHGVMPLFSSIEVYVEVLNENDNYPLSENAVYYSSIFEESPADTSVIQVQAYDQDKDPHQKISYKITSGNPEGFFTINSTSGLILTTSRKLDREVQKEHILEVLISDNGTPSLSSTTRVVVKVDDINDNAPEFEQMLYTLDIPARFNDSFDGKPMFQVLAYDKDEGENSVIHYSVSSGKGRTKFKIDEITGMIYGQNGFESGQEYELIIQAIDGGNESKSNTCKVTVHIINDPSDDQNIPTVKSPSSVKLSEDEHIGSLVSLIEASDFDNEVLWFDIIDGNERNTFYIGRNLGNILIAKKLFFDDQSEYVLNISVSDSVNTVYTQLNISVIDTNDHRPEFSKAKYEVEISEAIPINVKILQLEASDKDRDEKLIYSLYNAQNEVSLKAFQIDSVTGSITLKTRLDRETLNAHILTVMVRDGGTPAKRNYCRVQIYIHDNNDYAPHFSEKILVGKVFESNSVGSQVLKAFAVDHDKGENARITYSIVSGNVGSIFSINPEMGIISIDRSLDLSSFTEYTLLIKATDHGQPALSSTIPAHITITMADNAPPKFTNNIFTAEIYEDHPIGKYVIHFDVKSSSSLQFQITSGNHEDVFMISPSTGVITTRGYLDYEQNKFYNLSILATNLASISAECNVLIYILDINDNPPEFVERNYTGVISEDAVISSIVMSNSNEPLVIKALDMDSGINGLLSFEIVENFPKKYFKIDSSTGAISTTGNLDYETHKNFVIHVQVSDLGTPKLLSQTTARIYINITDVNDCPPVFTNKFYNATILLPTFKNITVIEVKASDPENNSLHYDIIDGNKHETFTINSKTGVIFLVDTTKLKLFHTIHVRVSDGKYSATSFVYVNVEKSENSGLVFQKKIYEGSVIENSTKVSTVCVVNVLGTGLNEHLVFKILNPTDMFVIGPTSGVIRTTGLVFDREIKDKYKLIVEAGSIFRDEQFRAAHVVVNVTVLDVNDNCPMFVNLPYYAVVSVDDEKGTSIMKVEAIDIDAAENGEVRYELIKGNGELFRVQRDSGYVEIKQNLEGHNRQYELLIAAYDKGINPCRTDVAVHIKVVDRSMPVFKSQFYSELIPENVEPYSPLSISIEAESPLSRKLIYSLVKGNELEDFAIDFSTGVISVINELDYETKQEYHLTLRATDSVSGAFSEVPVFVLIKDVNDCPPVFSQENYNVSISESAPLGSPVLQIVAFDNDTELNSKIKYSIQKTTDVDDSFYIENDGILYLKQQLDRESRSLYRLVVIANDEGVPSLNASSHVWITVLDSNDNPPKFEQNTYSCSLSISAKRGQFVTVLKATDPDEININNLTYAIVTGNQKQTFLINPKTAVIRLANLKFFGSEPFYNLNVTVSDGVYADFTKLKIDLIPTNLNSPKFTHKTIDVEVPENQVAGFLLTTVNATDNDYGDFGLIKYAIQSDRLKNIFAINQDGGQITTKISLDREKQNTYEIPVVAYDSGGRSNFLSVRVKVVDENDNEPVFLLKEYEISVYSNQSVKSPIVQIRSLDKDEGLSAQIEYSIYERNESQIKSMFSINKKTGEIFLIKKMSKSVGEVFQFFVRAQDKGKPSKYSEVPVKILIMGSKDYPPVFENINEKYFMSENTPTGTAITKVKMLSKNVPTSFKIVSEPEENYHFQIDEQGILSLVRPLNFEEQTIHLIAVVAITDSSPPVTALNEISVQVLDENDHEPEFECNPYVIELAENIEEGSSILKVIAHDKDQGSNGEIRYNIVADSEDVSKYFSIDTHNGWISTLSKLNDTDWKSEYKFHVTASDNGTPKHLTRTTVIIRLQDYNNNPTLFKEKSYKTSIEEDIAPGTVILTLDTVDKDKDIKTKIDFYMLSGDDLSQFQIRQTGEIFVSKPLDRETTDKYTLEIILTDGLFTDITTVIVTVTDVNDNPPHCVKYKYKQTLSEDILPGSFVLTVLATDVDSPENTHTRYMLTGDGSEHFYIDSDTGDLKTVKPLDREAKSKYYLTAHVHDKEHIDWECSSKVEIVLSDINDNPPVFMSNSYSVALSEDVEVGTVVTKLYATDNDLGKNRKIKYLFTDSFNGHFKISKDTGIVTLGKPLDRELRSSYNLTIEASDEGVPQLASIVTLIVNVQDINDNPPEFTNKFYFATVPEINVIGSEVIRVTATSKDTGVNADVYFSIIGGNEHRKFSIDKDSGAIVIADVLDFERAKDYFLTIQAIDGGIPSLSSVTTVNITITDCNDNPPAFTQESYSAKVMENAGIGDNIIQVTATDLDSGENGEIKYFIIGGDENSEFYIDVATGHLSVAKTLDREKVSKYFIQILAKDNGLPALSTQVFITIEIMDANDNSPIFTKTNYTAILQEDKPIGHPILQFSVNDKDDFPNAEPYTFDFRSGNEGNYFRLDQDAILKTASKFNHKIRDTYFLQIRVFDNGSPPLFSDAWVVVKIIQESQYPPILRPLEVNINSYLEEYSGGVIGKVFANDPDKYDTLTYFLSQTEDMLYPTQELFQINRTDGTLTALPRLDIGNYKINVSVTDGKFHTHTIVKINIELITENMLDNSIGIRFRDVTPESFIQSHRKGFLRALRNSLNCKLKDIVIVSIQPSSDDTLLKEKRHTNKNLDVLFTVKRSDQAIYSSDQIRKAVNNNLVELEEMTKLVVEEILRLNCDKNHCIHGVCKNSYALDTSIVQNIYTDVTSFVSAYHKPKLECLCEKGYGGNRCDVIVNECAKEPCPSYTNCAPDLSAIGYSCQCPEGYGGPKCETMISKCSHRLCYTEKNPISFNGKSYSQYKILLKKAIEHQLSLSLRIRTVQPRGNLMYAAGNIDYNILEIVNGALQYRFELGSGEGIIRISNMYISDGNWHAIKLEREGNSAKISIDETYSAQGSAPGASDILNLQSDELYLGAEVHKHPSILGFEDIQKGFYGCMDDIRISRVSVPLHKSDENSVVILKRFANVEFSCDATNILIPHGPCGSQPCMNGGTCKEKLNTFECTCHARYKGSSCEIDSDPCISSPCLFGGKCVHVGQGDYRCECNNNLTGKRCEYGKYCTPNPCKNNGVCEEGNEGPLCKCRHYFGNYCEFDIDECESNPCQNGGTCENQLGTYKCSCVTNMTGVNCEYTIFTYLSSILYHITSNKIIWLSIILITSIIIIIITIVCLVKCKRRSANRNITNNENIKDIVPNPMRAHEIAEFKRMSKISNLESNQREIGTVRPVSCISNSPNDPLSVRTSATIMLNNLDTLRSYGSAGDELENVPLDYVKNLNRTTYQEPIGSYGESEKASWSKQMNIASVPKVKEKNAPVPDMRRNGNCGRNSRANRKGPDYNEDQKMVGGYHWDCSDWAWHSETLPNITEIPVNEMLDSTSFHSNESNESNHNALNFSNQILNLNKPMQSKTEGSIQNNDVLNSFDGEEDNEYTTGNSYILHPNSYLPAHRHTITSESEIECLQSAASGGDSDDVESYGFPTARNLRKSCDNDLDSLRTTLEERNSLLEGYSSDLSNGCELDDPEYETENKPLNCLLSVHQTSV